LDRGKTGDNREAVAPEEAAFSSYSGRARRPAYRAGNFRDRVVADVRWKLFLKKGGEKPVKITHLVTLQRKRVILGDESEESVNVLASPRGNGRKKKDEPFSLGRLLRAGNEGFRQSDVCDAK